MIQSYRDLQVWQMGLKIAKEAYLLTKCFPREELYGLTSQIRRAATSIPANIAEGHGRESTQDFIRFLRIAQGSLKELETHILVAQEVGILARESHALFSLTDQQGKMLRALIRSLEAKSP